MLHIFVSRHQGFDVRSYSYYNGETCLADFDAMCSDLRVRADVKRLGRLLFLQLFEILTILSLACSGFVCIELLMGKTL